jgi:bifunctional non-homologous end joining protein LigD
VITHPEKLIFPDDRITKGDLARYYEMVAEVMVPHLRSRPLTMERFPSGIESKGFIQKDVSKGFPEWLLRVEVPKKTGTLWHPLIDDSRSLLWTANQNCVTHHVWASRVPNLHEPDLCIFDLDPSHEDARALIEAALAVRQLLEELGLPSWVKTSGSKGFHIVVPLDGAARYETVSEFAHGVGALLVQRHPSTFTQEFIKADRHGRILIDTGRNGYSATFAAAYTVRAKPGAPVSAPCTWSEVERGAVGPQTFTLKTMPQRLDEVGDLWAELHQSPVSLSSPVQRVRALVPEESLRAAMGAARRKSVKRSPKPS